VIIRIAERESWSSLCCCLQSSNLPARLPSAKAIRVIVRLTSPRFESAALAKCAPGDFPNNGEGCTGFSSGEKQEDIHP